MALFVIGILLVMLTEMFVFIRTRVPFVPSPTKDIKDLVQRLPITAHDYVYDLGSGNGKVVFAIEQLSGARVKGFQLAGWTHWYAKVRKHVTRSKAELVGDNFFKHHWGDATVVYAYLYPFLMADIGAKAMVECNPGTRIVARDFKIPNLTLHETWETSHGHEMFVYKI